MNNILEAILQIKDAHNEGVTFHFLENIKEVLRDESGKVTGVKVITMELGESDESGRRLTHEVAGSEHIIPCDLVVAAIEHWLNGEPLQRSAKTRTSSSASNAATALLNLAYKSSGPSFGIKVTT